MMERSLWRGRALRGLAALGLALALAWTGGFAWFLHRASVEFAPPEQADGIVALTGGTGRVETALRLLADGRAHVALLSGIGGGAELGELGRRAGVNLVALGDRVTLGRQATSTRGNAIEAAAWARDNGVHSLIVVTAGYHMPRALTEMRRAMPDVGLYPVTVMPPAMRGPGGIRDVGMARLMAAEYTKWLAAALGLSGIVAQHEPAVPGRTAHLSAER